MKALLHTYPYLLGSIGLLLVACATLWARPGHRRGMVWSGMLSAPCALYAVLFVPYYWEPDQLFRFLAGPEDVIFSFANGVVVWGMVAGGDLAIRRAPRWSETAVRGAMVTGFFVLQWLVFRALGLRLMDGACLSAITLLVLMMLRRPDLGRPALRGGVFFFAYYAAWLGSMAVLAPAFFEQWTHEGLSGVRIGPIPAEELVWAFLFGALWPCLMVYMVGESQRDGSRGS